MGGSNVAAVYAYWSHLPDKAFRALGFMANTVRDDDPDPRFWGGREALAGAIGRPNLPPEPAAGDMSAHAETVRKLRTNAFEAVKQAVRALIKAGALVVVERAEPGRNAVYGLRLAPAKGKVQPSPSRKDEPSERGRMSLPNGEGSSFLMGKAEPTPEEPKLGTNKETGEEQISTRAVHSPGTKITYVEARNLFRDLGPEVSAQYLERVTAAGSLRERFVAAAELYRAERDAS